MRRAFFILFALSLSACGIKGPLYLPTEKKAPPTSTQDKNAPASTPAPAEPLPASPLPMQPQQPSL